MCLKLLSTKSRNFLFLVEDKDFGNTLKSKFYILIKRQNALGQNLLKTKRGKTKSPRTNSPDCQQLEKDKLIFFLSC